WRVLPGPIWTWPVLSWSARVNCLFTMGLRACQPRAGAAAAGSVYNSARSAMQIDALRDSPLPLWQQPLFRRFVRTLAGLAIAAGFGYFFVSRGNLDQIDDSLERVNIGLVFLAVGVYFLNIGFQAIRWNYLIRHLGSPGPRRLLPAMLIGVMGNNILPLRMGMVLRAEYLWSRFRINAPALFSSVLLEGWLDGVVLAIVRTTPSSQPSRRTLENSAGALMRKRDHRYSARSTIPMRSGRMLFPITPMSMAGSRRRGPGEPRWRIR